MLFKLNIRTNRCKVIKEESVDLANIHRKSAAIYPRLYKRRFDLYLVRRGFPMNASDFRDIIAASSAILRVVI
jgi:hypothetical protein